MAFSLFAFFIRREQRLALVVVADGETSLVVHDQVPRHGRRQAINYLGKPFFMHDFESLIFHLGEMVIL
jgi:hypothetical protein